MENKVLISYVIDGTLNFLRREYRGLDREFYCEVENINYEYFEGDYDDAYVTVKCRCGRFKEDGDENYNFEYNFTLNLGSVENKSADFIAGMIEVILSVKNDYYDI